MTLSDTIITLGNNIVSLIGTRANKDLSNLSTTGESKLSSGGANTDLSNLSETGNAKFDAKVNKAGDTMTGNLTISKSSPQILKKNTNTDYATSMDKIYNSWIDYTSTTSPSANEYLGGFDTYDKSSNYMGGARTRFTTGGVVQSQIVAQRSIGGTEVSANITCGIDADGNKTYSPVQLIKSYVSGTSGYNIWSNGYCEQWGQGSGNFSVTFSKVFANTNYGYSVTGTHTDDTASGHDFTNTRTAKGMNVRAYSTGSWRVWGYLKDGQY